MDPYVGEIRMYAGANWAPEGWHLCDGSLLSINEYSALYALLGTTYGGDGVNNFALPNLVGRVPVGQGQGKVQNTQLTPRQLGQTGGADMVSLAVENLPAHSHTAYATSLAATTNIPGSAVASANGGTTVKAYAVPDSNSATKVTMSSGALCAAQGGNQPHNNKMPSLSINFIICINGIFPDFN